MITPSIINYNEMANLPEPDFDSAEDFDVAEDILKWFTEQVAADEIENVTDEMLERIVSGDAPGGHKATGVIFCECNNSALNGLTGLSLFSMIL